MLKFSPANTKLKKLAKKTGKKVYSLDLQAGVSCPFARDCKSQVIETPNGLRIQDGRYTQFRCYAASGEVLFTPAYRVHRNNYLAIKQAKSVKRIKKLILDSLPHDAGIIRLHSSGDFFSKNYFKAVLEVCQETPHIRWYGYTKALPYLVQYTLPKNLRLVASYGGKCDSYIEEYKLVSCKVVYSKNEAKKAKLSLDTNDFLCYNARKSFGVLIHGTQPQGSLAAAALSIIRKKS